MKEVFKLDWKKLQITDMEIESILKLNFLEKLGLEVSLFKDFRQKTSRNNLIITELVLLFLSLLFVPSLIIIICGKWLSSLNPVGSLGLVILISLVLSSMLILIFNFLIWQAAKKMRKAAKNIHKVKRYNSLLKDLKVLIELSKLSRAELASEHTNLQQVHKALFLSRESLLKGLQLEQLMLTSSTLQSQYRDRLMTNLEDELIQFMAVPASNSSEYQNLLSEAIAIGLSVHQQMRQNIALSSDLS